MKYTAAYFIKKFKAIPESKWWTGWFHNETRTKFCAIGHCYNKKRQATPESEALWELFKDFRLHVGAVNDGEDGRYDQPTPKLRILSALRYIQRQQKAK